MPEQRKLVTALFADIVGSVTLGERYDPEIVRAALDRYFVGTQKIASLYGGAVEKFIGDALLVVFGTPLIHEDDAERAIRAGLAIRSLVDALEGELHLDLAVRIGINSGEAVVADEAEQRFPITGDAINVAARLQQNAVPGQILVGALTERLTRAVIEYEPHERVVAKGKSQPILSRQKRREPAAGRPSWSSNARSRTRGSAIAFAPTRACARCSARRVTRENGGAGRHGATTQRDFVDRRSAVRQPVGSDRHAILLATAQT